MILHYFSYFCNFSIVYYDNNNFSPYNIFNLAIDLNINIYIHNININIFTNYSFFFFYLLKYLFYKKCI